MRKFIFTVALVLGVISQSFAQDYIDIIRYEDGAGNRYQLLVGEDGFSDCTPDALTQVAHLRLTNDTTNSEVDISLFSNGVEVPLTSIPSTSGLSVLFQIINGAGEFAEINSTGFNLRTATIDGTTITF